MAAMSGRPWRRAVSRLRNATVAVGTALLCGITGLWHYQSRIVYPGAYLSWRADPIAATHMGFSREVLHAPGVPTLSFFAAAPRPGMPVLVFFHGNGDIAAAGFQPLEPFLRRGYGAIVAEYPGYGGNPGHPTEGGIVRAARAYVHYAATTWPGYRLVLWGESLGTGAAIAARDAGPVAGLILDSPFTSIREIARRMFPAVLVGPAIPALVLVGGRDGVVPPDMGPAIAAATRCPATVLRTFPDVPHMVERHDPTGQAATAIAAFLERVRTGGENCERGQG